MKRHRCLTDKCKRLNFDEMGYCEDCIRDNPNLPENIVKAFQCYKDNCTNIAIDDHLMPWNMKACYQHNLE